jgi:hypothetical protein
MDWKLKSRVLIGATTMVAFDYHIPVADKSDF